MNKRPAKGHHQRRKPKSKRLNGKRLNQFPNGLIGGLGQVKKQDSSKNGSSKSTGDSTTVAEIKAKLPRSERRRGKRDKLERQIIGAKVGGDSAKMLTSDDPAVLANDLMMLKMALSRGYNVRNKHLLREGQYPSR